tara:strand:+ start:582 stop:974 length:393 start_codon:yes stop_codon:yes gene_type:complete
MVLSKSERMQREHDRRVVRSKLAGHSMDVFESMYREFKLFNRNNPEFNQELYSDWYNTQIRSRVGTYKSRVRSSISNPRKYTPFNIISQFNRSLRKQLRDKYRDSDRTQFIRQTYNMCSLGMDNYCNKVC